jgi:hypothetical protein
MKFSNGEDCITLLRVMAPYNLTCTYKQPNTRQYSNTESSTASTIYWRLLIYAASCTCKLRQCTPQNPTVYAVYISTVSQLDEGIKALLYGVQYSVAVSPALFNLAFTNYIYHALWTVMYERNTVHRHLIVFIAN